MSLAPPELIRDQLRADLELIDAALARVRATSTDLLGNAFRVELAERLENQHRVNRGLSYRIFGELADPPDGPNDSAMPAAVRLVDVIRTRLRIPAGEVRRRMKVAARITPRRSLSGPPTPPELPELGAAVAAGEIGEDHLQEVCTALNRLRHNVSTEDRDRAERTLVAHARTQDANFVAAVGQKLADTLNPDGTFDDTDRARRRALVVSRPGVDGMSKISGYLTPRARAAFDAVAAAVRPGHHVPESEKTVVDAATDTRTASQRAHDAFEWGLTTAISSGQLGTHRGLPVTIIATTTVAELEQAAAACVDPDVPMPAPARTGSGTTLPMRDLIAAAGAGALQYLLVFENHCQRPLYLGRSHRLATPDQRIACYGRDHGCTHPNCDAPGDRSEVHHAVDFTNGGPTDADNLYFACGRSNRAVSQGIYATTVTAEGRLGWTDGTGPPQVNRLHHPEELLADTDPATDTDPGPDPG